MQVISNPISHWNFLPGDLQRFIFNKLDARSLCSCSKVETRFNRLASDPLLWKDLLSRTFAFREDQLLPNLNFKEVYKINHVLRQNLRKDHYSEKICSIPSMFACSFQATHGYLTFCNRNPVLTLSIFDLKRKEITVSTRVPVGARDLFFSPIIDLLDKGFIVYSNGMNLLLLNVSTKVWDQRPNCVYRGVLQEGLVGYYKMADKTFRFFDANTARDHSLVLEGLDHNDKLKIKIGNLLVFCQRPLTADNIVKAIDFTNGAVVRKWDVKTKEEVDIQCLGDRYFAVIEKRNVADPYEHPARYGMTECRLIAVYGREKEAKVLDFSETKPFFILCNSIKSDLPANHILFYEEGHLVLWDVEKGQDGPVRKLELPAYYRNYPQFRLQAMMAGNRIAVVVFNAQNSMNECLLLWDASTGRLIKTVNDLGGLRVHSLDNNLLVLIREDRSLLQNSIMFIDLADGSIVKARSGEDFSYFEFKNGKMATVTPPCFTEQYVTEEYVYQEKDYSTFQSKSKVYTGSSDPAEKLVK